MERCMYIHIYIYIYIVIYIHTHTAYKCVYHMPMQMQ